VGENLKQTRLIELFLSFLKIGAFTFGGGYAMMPVMHKEVVDKKNWASEEDILKILVISESTPGVLAVNSATFIGYKIRGFWGSLVATLGVVLPSFVIISLLSFFILEFKNNVYVAYAFSGIRAGVAVLIFNAVFKLSKKIKKNWFTYVVLVISTIVALFTSFSAIYILLIGAIIGMIYGFVMVRNGGEQHA
jgi:chromate transporter